MVAFSGFYESHEPPPLGDARSIVPLHRGGQQNGQQSEYILHYRFVDCRVALAAAGVIRSKYSPDGGVQWLPVKPWSCCIGRCRLYCTITPPWLSKWPAMEVHLFVVTVFFAWHNCS